MSPRREVVVLLPNGSRVCHAAGIHKVREAKTMQLTWVRCGREAGVRALALIRRDVVQVEVDLGLILG